MKRVISLYLPSWPSDHWRKARGTAAPPAEVPVVITATVGPRKLVVDADAAAWALGVHPGLALAQAQARVPGLVIAEHEPAEDPPLCSASRSGRCVGTRRWWRSLGRFHLPVPAVGQPTRQRRHAYAEIISDLPLGAPASALT